MKTRKTVAKSKRVVSLAKDLIHGVECQTTPVDEIATAFATMVAEAEAKHGRSKSKEKLGSYWFQIEHRPVVVYEIKELELTQREAIELHGKLDGLDPRYMKCGWSNQG